MTSQRWFFAAAAGIVSAGLVFAYLVGDLDFGKGSDPKPVQIIFPEGPVRLAPGELRRIDFNVPRVLNFGYRIASDASPMSGGVVHAADWGSFAAGKQVWTNHYQVIRPPPPDWVNGVGGLYAGDYAYGLRCLEESRPCEGELELGLHRCPPQGCFSDDPDGDGVRNT